MKVFLPTNSPAAQALSTSTPAQDVGRRPFQALLSPSGPAAASAPAGESTLTGADILQATHDTRSLLMLQYKLSMGRDQMTSNILKVRHETAKNAIQNIR
jgi:hypothetical protein